MKRNLLAASVALSILTLAGCGEKEPELSSSIQQASYGIGLNMGESLLNDGLDDIDPDALALGMQDALGGTEPRLSEEELTAAFTELQTRAEERSTELAEEALSANEDFLAENAKREGVTTTASGLQYEVITEGEGEEQPAESDVVTVHYEGKLVDGTVFDSSISRGEPVELPVNGVIPGWVETLQLMNVGDKWKVTIPSELAYGARSPSPVIPPNSVLVFELELLGIQGEE
ncbi:FKBP-type peptidyl-prolyl cis-trans isomerase [Halopseudomonas laoshanensis]|uniref:Peptidyl-prolyl cis-trans isomerase n=1 Tax=Halopseudomonas laoshanensis TaxID=2268758 RepID=A0A7V7GVG8_9GAMM|nr:FKBP-type peptidyl-prolyl cis-trans isomerase [Halopseudomonas laoshanensis]KAA0695963.1 FKBP-type peptidyl-prolyl cis-trans isomerase [Halopseudomonas laoshanensis]WOD10246.1 FKBP-type peptidyl-prolyl cis-trans isomerase [Pseudomonas sp. NyZ704]